MSQLEYVPLPPPQDLEDLNKYLNTELQRISQVLVAATSRSRGQMYLATPPATDTVNTATTNTVTQYDTVGITDDMTVNAATGELTLLQDGIYEFIFETTVSIDANNVTVTFDITEDGTPLPGLSSSVFLKTATESIPITITGLGTTTRGKKISVEVRHNSGANRVVTYDALRFHGTGDFFN